MHGQVTSRRDFLPFGEELNAESDYRTLNRKYGQTDSVRQKFTGYEKDTETNLDFAEARYYNHQHARFTAVDPLLASGKSANPQTFNRYVYCLNNPLIFTDPDGLQVATHVGTVHTNKEETQFNRKPFAGSHIFEGEARYVPADDEFTYNVSKNGFYAIGKTAEILARGDGYSAADSLRRQEAYFNSSMPSSWVPELMIDPPGYEEASRTVGGRFTIADGETDYRTFMRSTDEPRAFAFTVTVFSTLGGVLGGSGKPPSIQKQPTYYTLFRGTDNPADQSSIRSGFLQSKAMTEGVAPTKFNTGFFARVRHSFTSDVPPSQFVSLTSSRNVANRFGGTVFQFQVHRNDVTRAWWNPFGESEFLAPGGTRVFNVQEPPK